MVQSCIITVLCLVSVTRVIPCCGSLLREEFSATALYTNICFSGRATRANIVGANRIACPFLFLFSAILSTEDTNCPNDLPFESFTCFIWQITRNSSHISSSSFKLRINLIESMWYFCSLHTAAVGLFVSETRGLRRVRPRCLLSFVIFWSAEMIIILPRAPWLPMHHAEALFWSLSAHLCNKQRQRERERDSTVREADGSHGVRRLTWLWKMSRSTGDSAVVAASHAHMGILVRYQFPPHWIFCKMNSFLHVWASRLHWNNVFGHYKWTIFQNTLQIGYFKGTGYCIDVCTCHAEFLLLSDCAHETTTTVATLCIFLTSCVHTNGSPFTFGFSTVAYRAAFRFGMIQSANIDVVDWYRCLGK